MVDGYRSPKTILVKEHGLSEIGGPRWLWTHSQIEDVSMMSVVERRQIEFLMILLSFEIGRLGGKGTSKC